MSQFKFSEYSLDDFQSGLSSGVFTSKELVKAFLDQINEIDHLLGSVIEVNPDALAIAEECDRLRSTLPSNELGMLNGIPVLIKDNINTADQMRTTAGSLALLDAPKPLKDAFIIQKLRNAGAVILGKTNMSEWANIRSSENISGWSPRGGFTRNPYVLDRSPLGSSSGSAVAVSANLCAVAVGTETDGSILRPAATCGVVGIKPSIGVISRSGIIPVSSTQDTAGPIARSVRDAATLLGLLAGQDSDDPTMESTNHLDYTEFLDDQDYLSKAKIGVLDFFVSSHQAEVKTLFTGVLNSLTKSVRELINIETTFDLDELWKAESIVLQYECKRELNKYFQRLGTESSIKSIDDVIEFNKRNSETEMKYFGQDFLITISKNLYDEETYMHALKKCRELSQDDGIDKLIDTYDLDCLIAPTLGAPHVINTVDLDPAPNSSTSFASVAGYPSITVPGGHISNLPIGVSFFGKKWSDPKLIGIAHGFEQLTKARKVPQLIRNSSLI